MGACVTKSSDEHNDINRNLSSSINDEKDIADDNHLTYDTSTAIDHHSINDIRYLSSESTTSRKYTSESPDNVHCGSVNNGDIYSGNQMVQSSPYHGCWSIGCNKNGAQGNGTKHNVMHLKKMTSLPENININNIITGNCGSTYLLCDNNYCDGTHSNFYFVLFLILLLIF